MRHASWILILVLLFTLLAVFSCGDDDDDSSDSGISGDDDTGDDDDDDDDDVAPDDDDDDLAPPTFISDRSFLLDTSLYSGHIITGDEPRPRKIGELGVGNGRVFALVGSTLPYHTLRNIIGPDYEREPRFFSDKRFWVHQGDQKIEIAEQWDMRVRKSSITLTRSLYDNGLELYTIDFAVRGGQADDDISERALVRLFIARNLGEEKLENLSIQMVSALGQQTEGVHVETVEYKQMSVRPLAGPFGEKGYGQIEIGALEPGEEAESTLLFAFTFDGEQPGDVFDAVAEKTIETLLDETYAWWTDWYDKGAALTTPDQKFNDLMDGLQVMIKVQQAHTGATCVMSEYTRTWTRDIVGPVRFYSNMGRLEDVRQMLDYYYLAVLERGNISNSFNSNIELPVLPDPPDWRAMGTMIGRLGGEAPSYLAMQYGYYFDASGDLGRVEQRYGMLLHATMHQNFFNDCLLPFSGDETFREIMGVGYGYLVGGTVYEDNWLSSNSSFLFVAAADRMIQFADLLGETADSTWFADKSAAVRQCAEDYYWLDAEGYYAATIDIDTFLPVAKPYEDVNTKPLWSRAYSGDDPHQIEQLLAMTDELEFEPGVIQTPIHAMYRWLLSLLGIYDGVFSGMTQGYYIDALTQIDHPKAADAFDNWKVQFNETGNVSEGMVRDDYGRMMYLLEPLGILSDLTSRFRPWEGGITGAALLNYLTGFAPDVPNQKVIFAPHVPADWDKVEFTGATFGEHTLGVEVTDNGQTRTFALTNGTGEYDLYLTLSVPGDITALTIGGVSQTLSDYETEFVWGRGRVKIGPIAIEAAQEFEAMVGYGSAP